MRIRTTLGRLIFAGLALAAAQGAAAANHFYVPFTQVQDAGGNKGLWLADTDHLGNPPYQVSNQLLDGPTVAILDDWTYDAVSRTASDVQPQMVVYGLAGHLYKVNLRTIQPVAQFSNGGYQELCGLTALDERPFAAARAYVQAVVEPVGSPNACSSGIGTQTWLIPANADNTIAPTVEPANWRVLGAFTDPTDDSFVRWIVWTGNEVDAYKANFSSHTTLLVGPPAGPAPVAMGREDGNALIMVSGDDGVTHTDRFYHLSMTGSGLVSTLTYPDAAPCVVSGGISGSVLDPGTAVVSLAEATASGYAIYALPLSGAAPSLAYSDSSGSKCGSIGGDNVSGGYVGVVEGDNVSGGTRVLGLNEAGPATQTPNVMYSGGLGTAAFINYTIDGHFWIIVEDFTGPSIAYSVVVADGSGTVLQDYSNTRLGDDIWHGFGVNAPTTERGVVYLFSPNATPCTGGTLTAVDPAAFTGINISGVPADACGALAYGWQPASVGYVREAGGTAPVEIDPVGGKLYMLLGPDPSGTFENIALLFSYPFL